MRYWPEPRFGQYDLICVSKIYSRMNGPGFKRDL